MRLAKLRRRQRAPTVGVTGPARICTRTTRLSRQVRPGDVVIVDHLDLDRVSAEALVDGGVSAVVNAAASISGRYPSLGPDVLLAAGIPLVDQVGVEVLTRVRDGERVRLVGGVLYRGQAEEVARGVEQTPELVAKATAEARAGLSAQLEAFAANTAEYLRRECDLLLDGVGVPEIRTSVKGRQVLIVVRGYGCREDLARLRRYIRECRPVLFGVEGGADALLEARYRPDLIVGDPGDLRDPDLASVSERALRCGGELIVPMRRDGLEGSRSKVTTVDGRDRLVRLGLNAVVYPTTGSSEDTAMLLADAKGAELIVVAGAHRSLVEFLDKGRDGMAGSFLTRLRVGGKLVDAKAVGRLYGSGVSTRHVVLLLCAGFLALGVAMAATPAGAAWLEVLVVRLTDLLSRTRSLFS